MCAAGDLFAAATSKKEKTLVKVIDCLYVGPPDGFEFGTVTVDRKILPVRFWTFVVKPGDRSSL